MPTKTFSTNEKWNAGIEAQCQAGYRTLAYSGSLGGGTLRISTQIEGGVDVPLADAKLTAATVDDNGDVVKQVVFQSSGNVFVELTGATTPTAVVSVQ
jgi:hypothetical protein